MENIKFYAVSFFCRNFSIKTFPEIQILILCLIGSTSDPIQVSTMEVSPDPITIPGNVVITLDAVVTTTVETATSLALVIKKKVFGVFVEIPCVDNVGSW